MLVTILLLTWEIFRSSTCQYIVNCLPFIILFFTQQSYKFSLNLFSSKSPNSLSWNRNAIISRPYRAFFSCTYNISDMLGPLKRYFPYCFGSVLKMNYTICHWKKMWAVSSSGIDALRNAPCMFTMATSLPSTASIAAAIINNYISTASAYTSIGSIFPHCLWPSAHCLAFTVLSRFHFINTRYSEVSSSFWLFMSSVCFGWKVTSLFMFNNSSSRESSPWCYIISVLTWRCMCWSQILSIAPHSRNDDFSRDPDCTLVGYILFSVMVTLSLDGRLHYMSLQMGFCYCEIPRRCWFHSCLCLRFRCYIRLRL